MIDIIVYRRGLRVLLGAPDWKSSAIRYALLALLLAIVQFWLFKLIYPHANYMPDSYSYIDAARTNIDVNTWPIAYSKFLRLFSVFSHSDKVLTFLQYLLIQSATLVFIYSVFYLVQPERWMRVVLYCFVVLNPLPLLIANYISADALFISISLLWITQLLWILYRPVFWQLLIHALLIYGAFLLRYNAIYYPLISIACFLLADISRKRKLLGIVFTFPLILLSIVITGNQVKTATGQRLFSPFGGWQLANNAIYMYEHIPPEKRITPPAKLKKLDQMVIAHIDTLDKVKLTATDSLSNFFYLWSDKGPLKRYMTENQKKDSAATSFKRWASVAPLYQEYADFLIKTYPLEFISYWIFPNSIKYFTPPPEFIGQYNMGKDSVSRLAKDWFRYKSTFVYKHTKKWEFVKISILYPSLIMMINIGYVLGLLGLLLWGGLKEPTVLRKAIIVVAFFWLVNMGFSVFASPIVLRYQYFPTLVLLMFAVIQIRMVYIILDKEEALKRVEAELAV